MKANSAMHLPKDDDPNRLPSFGSADFDLEDFLRSINEPTVSAKKDSWECPECQHRGKMSYIRPYQLNFHEAIYLCPNPTCSYPMKEDGLINNFTFKREASLAVKDDKQELYRQSSDSFDDLLNEFNDPIFDNLVNLTGELMETNVNISKVNEPKTSVLDNEVSSISLANSLASSPSDNILDVNLDTQQHSPDFTEVLMDTNSQSVQPHTGIRSHLDANKDYPMSGEIDLPAPEDICSATHSETPSKDEAMEVASEKVVDKRLNDRITVQPSVVFSSLMMQWRNENNSCWLDSILQMVVTSGNIRAALSLSGYTRSKAWIDLINAYDQSQVALNDAVANSDGSAISTDSLSVNLNNARENFLAELRKSAKKFEYGEFQSLLEMLPLSLKIGSDLENIFKTKLLWHFQCGDCSYQSARRSDGLIVSMPNTLNNFHPLNAQFKRRCQACKSENASTSIWMEQLPPCIVFHFQSGLPHSNLRILDFALCGRLYCLSAVVQYITVGPKHFVTWIRDIKKDRWLRCDDLCEPICQWTQYQPKIPPHEIHMAFWERNRPNSSNNSTTTLETIRNEEVINWAESIPNEHFLAHEEETIVIPEDAGSSSTTYDNSQNQEFGTSQTEACAKSACEVTANIETSTLIQTSGQNVGMHAPTVHFLGQNGQQIASSHTDLPLVPLPTTGFTHTTLQPVTQPVNAAKMMIPTDADRQNIQIITTTNGCNIFIVPSYGQTGQPFYLVPGSQKSGQSSFPTLPSFINNPHSYNLVAQGVSGPLQNETERPKGPLQRMRRQYKLSGYSKRVGTTNRYTPLQASKSCSSIKSADSICDAASVKSCNSKGDSDTRSELSELSDMLPDFEINGYARNHVQMVYQTTDHSA